MNSGTNLVVGGTRNAISARLKVALAEVVLAEREARKMPPKNMKRQAEIDRFVNRIRRLQDAAFSITSVLEELGELPPPTDVNEKH
ncbi:MAG: hypothetical protein CMK32_09805 [Porticoccaceae bacterium]|nr:hypothetical protein [Porticoccaceae bacterium]|tara:strand:- start:345 stop:602 length:258 start_codon:yes stop_codon:yes gene_type:complete